MGLWIGVAAFVGARLGLDASPDGVGEWCIDAAIVIAVASTGAGFLLRRLRRLAPAMLLVGVGAGAFAWSGHHAVRGDPSLLRIGSGNRPELVRVKVRLLERSLPGETMEIDLLDRFVHPRTDPSWRADAELVSIRDGDGWRNASGTIRLEFTSSPDELSVGCTLVVTGWLRADSSQTGGIFGARHDPSPCRRRIGTLRTDGAPVLELDPPWMDATLNAARSWLDENLLRCLGSGTPERMRCLVVAMTTGRTLPGIRPLREAFQRAGLGHFLAISGFNVAVLFTIARCGMEWTGIRWRLRGWILLALGAIFLAVVEPGVSVLRAGIAGSMAGLAMGLRRGWSPDGVLGFSATVSLILDPCAAADLGFQLSYGAVYGLLHGTAPIERLLGSTEVPDGFLGRVLKGIRTSIAASLAAWLVSLPITLASNGSMHPWCAVVSTILGPLAAMITVLSSIGAVTGWIPGTDSLQGPLLGGLAWCMEAGVRWSARLPMQRWTPGPVPWPWVVIGLIGLLAWWARDARAIVRHGTVITLVLGWLLGAALIAQRHEAPPEVSDRGFSWTTIPMGEGCAHVIQCGGHTTLIDAGSRTLRACGSGRLVPALEALGVRSVDRILVRQSSIDRFAAIPELVEVMPVTEVVLGPGWDRTWPADSAAGVLLQRLRERGVRVRPADREVSWFRDPLTWRCLTFRRDSIGAMSMLVIVQHADWPSGPIAVMLHGADPGSIDHATLQGGMGRPCIVEWPPVRSGIRERSDVLKDLGPECVLDITRSTRSDENAMRTVRSDVLWGRPMETGPMRVIVRPVPQEIRLFRWVLGRWQEVCR